MAKVSVVGTGTWGIALCMVLLDNGHQVTAWSKIESEIQMLQETHQHPALSGVEIPEGITYTTNIETACTSQDLIVLSVPSIYVRSTAKLMAPYIKEGQVVVCVSKGIEKGTLMTLDAQINQEIPGADVAVLSGPSHAEEVSRKMATTVVAAARTKETAELVQHIFMNSKYFRVYTSPDVLGVELGGALKNVIALAAGCCEGMGCGDNAMAALITRGIAEITRLGVAMGGQRDTFAGLSGIGDLIVTCESRHSRNHQAGLLIGQGYSTEEAMAKVKMVVEGVYSAEAANALAKKYQVELPIIEQIYSVLFEGKDVREVLGSLMMREKTGEMRDTEWK